MAAVKSTGLSAHGLRSEFFAAFNRINQGSYWKDLCTPIQSTSDSETQKFLGQLPRMREWGTGRIAKGVGVESYTVANLKYELTLEVDKDEIADDQTGQIMMRVRELGEAAGWHKDVLLVNLLLNGATTGYNSYDGTTFFAADHSSGASGAQTNLLTFDVGTVAGANLHGEPDSATIYGPKTAVNAFNSAVGQMMTLKDDQGEYMHRRPSGFVICCSPLRAQNFRDGLAIKPGGNDASAPSMEETPRVISFPELSASDAIWYLLKTDGVVRPFIFQDREPLTFSELAAGSAEDFHREKFYYGARARYRVTYGYWTNALQVTMST